MVDAYVIGTGLPELAAALELAEVGLSVRVGLPAAQTAMTEPGPEGATGGSGHTAPRFTAPGPVRAHGGDAAPLRDPDGSIAGMLQHVAQPVEESGAPVPVAAPVIRRPGPVLLRDPQGSWIPQPTPAMLGIPAVPLSSQAIAMLGTRGAMRAYLDRVKPVLTIGKTHDLGTLVRARLGEASLQRLVEPFVRERFGVDPDDVEVAIATPGLNEALTRVGSLSGAVSALTDRNVARETCVRPDGGWAAFGAALLERLGWYGVVVDTAPVRTVARGEDDWALQVGDETVRARSLVVGSNADERRSASWPELESSRGEALGGREGVERVRAHVSFSITDPELPALELPEAEAGSPEALDAQTGTRAVAVVDLAGAERWSVEFALTDDGEWVAHASGPAVSAEAADSADPAGSGDTTGHEALERSGWQAVVAAGGNPIAGSAGLVHVRTAPYLSTEEREAEVSRTEQQREDDPDLLVVGDGIHGGDLSAALADARLAAVHLRRRLVGIAE